jgi:hypothetical protein
MWRRLQALAPVLVGTGLLLVWVLVMYWPAFPSSALGWLALVFAGLPLLLMAEKVGSWALERPFLKKWSPASRVMYGVITMLAFLAVFIPVYLLARRLIAS